MSKIVQKYAWHLPWRGVNIPHALIDITRKCNITCESCYNNIGDVEKTLDQVKLEIGELLLQRKLNSISIIGGEPTLHSGLFEIIRYIRGLNLYVELFTNGLLIDNDNVAKLGEAGLNLAFIHIQKNQKRPDLPDDSAGSIERLLDEKASLLANHGIDVGIAITAYNDRIYELIRTINYFLKTPQISYMLITLNTNINDMDLVEGDIIRGMRCTSVPLGYSVKNDEVEMSVLLERIKKEMNFLPFGYLGSNVDISDPRWVSYMLVCSYYKGELKERLSLRASSFEKFYLQVERIIKGRYPFHTKSHQAKLITQLVLNSFMGGDFLNNIAFMVRNFKRKYKLKGKKILFQKLANIDKTGRVVHCSNCPDAVIKNGKLVPVCISDKVRR